MGHGQVALLIYLVEAWKVFEIDLIPRFKVLPVSFLPLLQANSHVQPFVFICPYNTLPFFQSFRLIDLYL
jgi:hypothetical protein